MSDQACYRVMSWPAAPHPNQIIGRISEMLERTGARVNGGNPVRWRTPLDPPDVFVIHWADAIFWSRPRHLRLWFHITRVLANLILLRVRGTRVVWFVHNLEPHDLSSGRRSAWLVYARGLSRLVDGWFTLSPSTAGPVLQRYPALERKRHTFVWHPPYAERYRGSRSQARIELGLPADTTVFGHVGLLRPYKNLKPFAARFSRFAPNGALLLLAGEPLGGLGREFAALSRAVRGLDYREGRLSDAEFDRALIAIDVFVAPYARFLHSGALVHALARGCVVIAPRAPFTEDLAQQLGPQWVALYDGDAPDEHVLAEAAAAARRQRGTSPDLSFMEPAANMGRLQHLMSELGLPMPTIDREPVGLPT